MLPLLGARHVPRRRAPPLEFFYFLDEVGAQVNEGWKQVSFSYWRSANEPLGASSVVPTLRKERERMGHPVFIPLPRLRSRVGRSLLVLARLRPA
jgi:hypothetical protein